MQLADILEHLTSIEPAKRAEIEKLGAEACAELKWVPNPGPQTDAYFSEADEIFFGGQAGGGKSDLGIGLAINEHDRSLLLRRTNKEADGLVERVAEILGSRDGYSSQKGTWRLPNGNIMEIGGCQLEEDKQKYKGIPHSFLLYDEVSDFLESQYVFINGWNRSANPKQRCRIIAAGNPPTRPEGMWVVKRWAAWLDPSHSNPALPGELRWYTTGKDGDEIEVDGRGPHIINGESVNARSRTFIPSKLSDNPDLASTDYAATLASLPKELRAAYRDGDFGVGLRDEAFQAIPSEWVRAAQKRWTSTPPVGVPMCAIGVDVAQGGSDQTVLAIRHDGWYAPLISVPGADTPNGKVVAGLVVTHRRDGAVVIVDLGGGWGGDAYAHLKVNDMSAVGYLGVKKSLRRTVDQQLRFFNVRTEAYWRFREALDISQAQGSTIMLPADPILVADLCAPMYSVKSTGKNASIAIESKEDVCERLGRSTDRGDAVVMAWFAGTKQANLQGGWKGGKVMPKVVMGHASTRRK